MSANPPAQRPRSAAMLVAHSGSTPMHRGRVELQGFYRSVMQRAASAAGIADVDWKSLSELREELALGFPKVATMVQEFIEAYDDWYCIHEGLERIRTERLSTEQQKALANAIAKRDDTRRALLLELQK